MNARNPQWRILARCKNSAHGKSKKALRRADKVRMFKEI